MTEVVLAGAVRTPTGKLLGSLTGYTAPELGALVVREAVTRAGIDPAFIDGVSMGNVIQAGNGQNPARQAALNGGLPNAVAAHTVNMVCGSGLKAIMLSATAIRAGEAQCLVAGGMESMTNAPHLARVRAGVKLGDTTLRDSMDVDGLHDAYTGEPMVETGNVCAREHGITRAEADAFALRSHERAHRAAEAGHFKLETLPVEARPAGGAKQKTLVERDEGIRADTSLDRLSKLALVGNQTGFITAGNSSQISDGAAAMIVASRAFAQEHGLPVLATVKGYATAGVEPMRVMSAPIPGVQMLLKQQGITIDDVDLVEHNEAFATASLAVMKKLGIPDERFNVSGGAVALGHPLGASGARVLTTLLYNMKRLGKDTGIATLCLGGGNSVQILVERT